MEPQPRLAIVATIQQAITSLLTTYEPEFLRFGYSLFIAFATILIVWQGVRMMLNQDSLGDHLFEFAKLLLFISFGYALIAFYESPIPGFGVSFSNLITDQAQEFANILDARSLELVFDHLDQLWQQFVQPDGRYDVGHHPVVGIKPALTDHALGSEIHHMGRALSRKQGLERLEIVVEIDPLESDAARALLPLVGQEGVMRLVRAAGRDHVMAGRRQKIGKGRPRKRVRSENQVLFVRRHRLPVSPRGSA